MTRKLIKRLAIASYTNNKLDEKRVNKIVKNLNRNEFKIYIKFLKNIENGKKITVHVSKVLEKQTLEKELRKLFPGKQIELKEDKSLIAGIRILDDDNVYDFNLKNRLNNMILYING